MAGIKISALPAASSAQSTDVFPADQTGPITRKIALSQVATLFNSNFVQLSPSGNQTISGAFNLTMTTGSLVAPTILPGNLSLTTNTMSSTNTNGNMYFQSNGTGAYIFGQAAGVSPTTANNIVAAVGVPGTAQALYQGYAYLNSSTGSTISLLKSRSTSVGSFAVVQAGDFLGRVTFLADTGAAFSTRATINSNVTTVGAFVGSNLTFNTSGTGSASNVVALTIDDTQIVTLAHALPVGSGGLGITSTPSNGQIPIGNGTTYTAATLTQGAGVTITNGSGSITIAASAAASGGFSFNSVSGTSQALVAGNAYIFNNAATTTGTLPLSGSSTIGDTIKIKGNSSAAFVIQANTGQTIKDGSNVSTTAGTATSAAGTDSIQLVYIAANTWSTDFTLSSGFTLA